MTAVTEQLSQRGEHEDRDTPAIMVHELNGDTYTCIAELGSGTEGDVFKAVRGSDGHVVAFKEYHGRPPEQEIPRMVREVQLRRLLPVDAGAPTVLDVGETSGARKRFALVSEYREGQCLEAKLGAGWRPTGPEVRGVVDQVLGHLHYFHERQLLHRDVKPSNILQGEDGTFSFPDLGLICDANRGVETQTIGGTPDYAAPEQYLDKAVPASDVYSVGIVAWYLLARKNPNTSLGQKFNLERQDVNFTPFIGTLITAEQAAIYQKMVAKKVEDRYQNADEALADLDAGRVTALVPVERKGLVARTVGGVWDWIRYEKVGALTRNVLINDPSAKEDGINGQVIMRTYDIIYKKRFGDGPEVIILDSSKRRVYVCDKVMRLLPHTSTSGDDSINPHFSVGGESAVAVQLASGNYGFVGRESGLLVEHPASIDTNKVYHSDNDDWVVFNYDERWQENKQELIRVRDGKVWAHEQVFSSIHRVVDIQGTAYLQGQLVDGNDVLVDEDGGRYLTTEYPIEQIIEHHDQTFVRLGLDDDRSWLARRGEDGSWKRFGKPFKKEMQGGGDAWRRQTMLRLRPVKLTDWDGDTYAALQWTWHGGSEEDQHIYSSMAEDGTDVGGEGYGRNKIKLLEGIGQHYALCLSERQAKVVNKHNETLFGGAHAGWSWYSPESGLEVVCFTEKVKGPGGSDIALACPRDKEGNRLYTRQVDIDSRGVTMSRVSQRAVEIDGHVIREVYMGYGHSDSLAAAHTGHGDNSELRTQEGVILTHDYHGNMTSWDKTADGKLSVLHNDGRRETIDIAAKVEEYHISHGSIDNLDV